MAMHEGPGIRFFQVDSFTERPFAGNPAAVCLIRTPLPERLMQKIAAEMNLSETAFVLPLHGSFEETTVFRIRWFTPRVEVPLCGHATLAAASILFSEVDNQADSIVFESRSGRLKARRSPEGYTLDFPSNPPRPHPIPDGILQGLGIRGPDSCWLSREAEMLLVPLRSYEEVLSISPDYPRLLDVSDRDGAMGIIITAPGPDRFDFCSRYFGPWEGINEDPVTGSAHTVLAPYWGNVLGKSFFTALQASERTGILHVRIVSRERVELTGKAKLVMKGRLYL
jgi:PhzF family phenazine biosynthesis protein